MWLSTIWGNLTLTEKSDVKHAPVREVPSALERFDLFTQAIGDRRPAIFLDYDGTLTPIVSRPELAILSDEGRSTVDKLGKVLPVAVVSGRDRPDVERLVGIDSLIFVGSHGFDIKLPSGEEISGGVGEEFMPVLDQVEAELHRRLDPIDGALVERKKFSIAAHYRLVSDEDYGNFRAALEDIVQSNPKIKEKTGKKVFELQPDIDWDKGKAVMYLLETLDLDKDGIVPMFFGDDVTDEDAFAALQSRGVSVIVSPKSDDETDRVTAATFRVEDPDEILDLLGRLTEAFTQ